MRRWRTVGLRIPSLPPSTSDADINSCFFHSRQRLLSVLRILLGASLGDTLQNICIRNGHPVTPSNSTGGQLGEALCLDEPTRTLFGTPTKPSSPSIIRLTSLVLVSSQQHSTQTLSATSSEEHANPTPTLGICLDTSNHSCNMVRYVA